MATVTTKRSGITFVLELSEAEAKYVASALMKTDPRHLTGDPVYDALHDALHAAGVDEFGNEAI